MRRLYLLCAALVLILAGLTVYDRAEPDTFYGIADTKELTISSESAVEIKRILVAPGQLVWTTIVLMVKAGSSSRPRRR